MPPPLRAYSKSIPFSGDPNQALDAAAAVLAANSFCLVQKRPTSLEFRGPGLQSTRQNPILGASRVFLEADAGRLSLEAELGGVEKMKRFLIYLPLGLAVGFVLLFGVGGSFLFSNVAPPSKLSWFAFSVPLSVLPLAPWLVLSPLMTRSIRRRTHQALDSLLANASGAAGGKPMKIEA